MNVCPNCSFEIFEFDIYIYFQLAVPNDTLIAIQQIRRQFSSKDNSILPIILKSQLFYTIEDKGEIERDLNYLEEKSIIKIYQLFTRFKKEEYAIILIEDLKFTLNLIKEDENDEDKKILDDYLNEIILKCPHEFYISKSTLFNMLGVDEKSIAVLIRNGLLVRKDKDDYWFNYPNAGIFSKYLSLSRECVLKFIKKSRFKEIDQEELERKKFKDMNFPVNYIIKDLVGMKILSRIKISSGYLLRLNEKEKIPD